MLFSLHIENIAVIKSIDIDFSKGFSALTGETGAGKSIIIDSINLLLGKKVEKELIRNGESSAMVSGLFSDLGGLKASEFAEAGVYPDEDGNILIQRTVNSEGRSQIRINGRAVSLSLLKEVAPLLINIHGQNDTHELIDSKNHLQILDTFADNVELMQEYNTLYHEYDSIRKEIKEVSEKAVERARLVEILEYQIKDIDSAALCSGEEEDLVDKKIKIKNSERILKQAGFVFKALKGSEKGSVFYLLDRSISALSSLSDVLPQFAEYSEKLRDFLYQVDDIAEEVYGAIDDLDEDPTEKLNKVEARLDKISKLKKKYGVTVDDILAFRENAFSELEKLKNSEDYLNELERKLKNAYNKCICVANIIHTRRKEAAVLLEGKVRETLEFLDMPKVVFFASIKEMFSGEERLLCPDGYDRVEFYISANKGIDPKPLSKIASGGELARIMLALKSVVADKDEISTIIFDEIDAGVSGKTARKIGIKMLSLARSSQIICVTHSAQIASLADTHLLISKNEINGATETSVDLLNDEGRISELSRILGGINVTDSQRAAAKDMLRERDIYLKLE